MYKDLLEYFLECFQNKLNREERFTQEKKIK